MNYIDYLILAIVVFFVVKGLFRGLIHEVLGFLGLTLSLIVATKFTSDAAVLLKHLIKIPPSLTTALSFIFLFIAAQLCVQLASYLLLKVVQFTFILWLEKLSGGLVGLLKGGIVVSLLALLLSIIPLGGQVVPDQDNSILLEPVKGFAPKTFNLMMKAVPNSKSFYEEVKESFEDFSASGLGTGFLKGIQDENEDETQKEQ